jgi:hypothetical protein
VCVKKGHPSSCSFEVKLEGTGKLDRCCASSRPSPEYTSLGHTPSPCHGEGLRLALGLAALHPKIRSDVLIIVITNNITISKATRWILTRLSGVLGLKNMIPTTQDSSHCQHLSSRVILVYCSWTRFEWQTFARSGPR